MSAVPFPARPVVFRPGRALWLLAAVAAALLYAYFRTGIDHLLLTWSTREEYSYGFMIAPLVGFLLWQRKDRLERLASQGAWPGAAMVGAGTALGALGELAWSPLIVNYGLLMAVWGLALACLGWRAFRQVAVPLGMLAFMVPLPEFVLLALSQELQLISSRLGVTLLRACEISVYLEGNVIDLGTMKLQVVEACSGLRYLFALVTLACIAAYFFQGALWKRAIIVASSIPITVLMNSARIALVGVTVEHFGREAAEGVLHDFEGIVIFLGSVLLLIAQMWLLARIGPAPMPLARAFGLELPPPAPPGAEVRARPVPAPFIAGLALLGLATAAQAWAPERAVEHPARRGFAEFPLQIADWRGRAMAMEREHFEILRPDDYLLADFSGAGAKPVNLLVVYFATQANDRAPHSPRSCIPGAGWEIARLERRVLPELLHQGAPVAVNRALIRRGEQVQLVYYWLHQSGRVVTNEYAAKFHVLWNTLSRRRSDGALVRLITPVFQAEGEAAADARLAEFARQLAPVLLPAYLPD